MENEVDAGTRIAASINASNVSFNQAKPRRTVRPSLEHGIKVRSMAGRKVVKPNHRLPEIQQCFEQV
jgi:hypothetical protein